MRIAETVTFGGSGLERAAGLRGDADRIAELWAAGQVLPIWRGRPLLRGEGELGWLRPGDAVLAGVAAEAIFLGLDEDAARFTVDVSAWQPEEPTVAVPGGFFDASRQSHPQLDPELGFQELRSVMVHLTPREAELVATAKALTEWHRSHGFCAACGAKSEMVHAGWQRTCPACNASHFPRTDPVVIMLVTRGNSLLMGRGKGWPERMYSLLAGFIEPGETIEAAVRREVFEESGICCGEVDYLASQPWPFPASLMLGCRAEATSEAITLDPEELEAACWVSREEMLSVMAGQHPDIRTPRKGAIASFLIANWLADRLD